MNADKGRNPHWIKSITYNLKKPVGLFKWENPRRPHMRIPIPDYRSHNILKTSGKKTYLEPQAKGKIIFKYIEETPSNRKLLENAKKEAEESDLKNEEFPILVHNKLRDLKTRHRIFIMDPPPGFDPQCKEHWVQFFTTIITMQGFEKRGSTNDTYSSPVSTTIPVVEPPAAKKTEKRKLPGDPRAIDKQRSSSRPRREPLLVFPGVSVSKKYIPVPSKKSSVNELPKLDLEKIREMLPNMESSEKEKGDSKLRPIKDKDSTSTSDADVDMPLPAASDSLIFYKKKLQKAQARDNLIQTTSDTYNFTINRN